MTAMNLNRVIRGPVTAVPVVAGKGVRIVPDVENNRFVAEVDETVLFESNVANPGDTQQTYNLSESPLNFEKIGVYLFRPVDYGSWFGYTEFIPAYFQSTNRTTFTVSTGFTSNGIAFYIGVAGAIDVLTTTWKDILGFQSRLDQTSLGNGYFSHIYKIVGIHRIANN